eukprot:GCRY01003295.1.p1 GENE.GCRY01003295.1~~GCRY01003295.1.p1  ORF type:complete len:865 (-),score=184.71 GCRY01003295.1:263-2857(-)
MSFLNPESFWIRDTDEYRSSSVTSVEALLNPDLSTYWRSQSTRCWFACDFQKAVQIVGIKITPSHNERGRGPRTCSLSAANSIAGPWTPFFQFSCRLGKTTHVTFQPQTLKAIRVSIQSTQERHAHCQIAYVQFFHSTHFKDMYAVPSQKSVRANSALPVRLFRKLRLLHQLHRYADVQLIVPVCTFASYFHTVHAALATTTPSSSSSSSSHTAPNTFPSGLQAEFLVHSFLLSRSPFLSRTIASIRSIVSLKPNSKEGPKTEEEKEKAKSENLTLTPAPLSFLPPLSKTAWLWAMEFLYTERFPSALTDLLAFFEKQHQQQSTPHYGQRNTRRAARRKVRTSRSLSCDRVAFEDDGAGGGGGGGEGDEEANTRGGPPLLEDDDLTNLHVKSHEHEEKAWLLVHSAIVASLMGCEELFAALRPYLGCALSPALCLASLLVAEPLSLQGVCTECVSYITKNPTLIASSELMGPLLHQHPALAHRILQAIAHAAEKKSGASEDFRLPPTATEHGALTTSLSTFLHDLFLRCDEVQGDSLATGAPGEPDVCFLCENGCVYAHKALLAIRSPFFASLLFQPLFVESQQENIVLKDIQASVFKRFLHFIYTDRIDCDCPPLLQLREDASIALQDSALSHSFSSELLQEHLAQQSSGVAVNDFLAAALKHRMYEEMLALGDRLLCSDLLQCCAAEITASLTPETAVSGLSLSITFSSQASSYGPLPCSPTGVPLGSGEELDYPDSDNLRRAPPATRRTSDPLLGGFPLSLKAGRRSVGGSGGEFGSPEDWEMERNSISPELAESDLFSESVTDFVALQNKALSLIRSSPHRALSSDVLNTLEEDIDSTPGHVARLTLSILRTMTANDNRR